MSDTPVITSSASNNETSAVSNPASSPEILQSAISPPSRIPAPPSTTPSNVRYSSPPAKGSSATKPGVPSRGSAISASSRPGTASAPAPTKAATPSATVARKAAIPSQAVPASSAERKPAATATPSSATANVTRKVASTSTPLSTSASTAKGTGTLRSEKAATTTKSQNQADNSNSIPDHIPAPRQLAISDYPYSQNSTTELSTLQSQLQALVNLVNNVAVDVSGLSRASSSIQGDLLGEQTAKLLSAKDQELMAVRSELAQTKAALERAITNEKELMDLLSVKEDDDEDREEVMRLQVEILDILKRTESSRGVVGLSISTPPPTPQAVPPPPPQDESTTRALLAAEAELKALRVVNNDLSERVKYLEGTVNDSIILVQQVHSLQSQLTKVTAELSAAKTVQSQTTTNAPVSVAVSVHSEISIPNVEASQDLTSKDPSSALTPTKSQSVTPTTPAANTWALSADEIELLVDKSLGLTREVEELKDVIKNLQAQLAAGQSASNAPTESTIRIRTTSSADTIRSDDDGKISATSTSTATTPLAPKLVLQPQQHIAEQDDDRWGFASPITPKSSAASDEFPMPVLDNSTVEPSVVAMSPIRADSTAAEANEIIG